MAILKHQCKCGNDSYNDVDGFHVCANCNKTYRKIRQSKFKKEVAQALKDGSMMNDVKRFLETGKLN